MLKQLVWLLSSWAVLPPSFSGILARSTNSSLVICAALAFPPFRPPSLPSATAAGFFSGLSVSVSAMISSTTDLANWFSSLLERLGIDLKYHNSKADLQNAEFSVIFARTIMMNQNAIIGMDVERLFKNSIGHHPHVINILKDHFEIVGDFAKAFSTGTDAGKSDVIVRFTDATLSANIKAYKAGFNQLTRLPIKSFCNQFGLTDLQSTFEAGAIRVAGKQGRFILQEDEKRVVEALQPLAESIVHFSLSRLENPELLVLYNRKTNLMNVYDMNTLLDNLDYEIAITPRGVIKIGSYITIQRKGGNGVHSLHIEKTSLNHPGNNLQVKMKVGT